MRQRLLLLICVVLVGFPAFGELTSDCNTFLANVMTAPKDTSEPSLSPDALVFLRLIQYGLENVPSSQKAIENLSNASMAFNPFKNLADTNGMKLSLSTAKYVSRLKSQEWPVIRAAIQQRLNAKSLKQTEEI